MFRPREVMSSEAAYFPDAVASASEAREAELSVTDIPSASESAASERAIATANRTLEASDDQLMEQVRQGSKDALAELFRKYARSVRNVAYRILHNEEEADDLVQEVFLFIFRKAASFDASQGAARSWIFQLAYHRAFDKRRYLNSNHFYTGQDLEETARCLADPRYNPPFHELSIEGILGKQLAARFNARLTPEQRETIRLFFFEGYSLREIAQLTGRSLVNVRQHYYRGLARLRKYILPEKLRPK